MTLVGLGIPSVRDARPPTRAGRSIEGLVDRYGRVARDLRISVTEKCSLRCTYCMPEEGLPSIPRDELLTPVEIARLVGIAVRDLGVHDVRFTGGEPLMRADLEEILALSSAVAGAASLSLTTNGIGLDKRIHGLVAAGLTRINISLDTVDRDHFTRLTRRDRLPAVLAGIEAARAAGLTPVKINAVLMADTLAGAPALVDWALGRTTCALRFIEQMPLDADATWDRSSMVTASDLVDADGRPAHRAAPRRPVGSRRGVARWMADPATVGIIASVTRSFCEACDRTRDHARRAPCARACSATTRPISAGCCAAVPTTRRSPTGGAPRCGTSPRVTAWTATTSCARCARWERSVAEVRYFAAAAEAAGVLLGDARCADGGRAEGPAARAVRGCDGTRAEVGLVPGGWGRHPRPGASGRGTGRHPAAVRAGLEPDPLRDAVGEVLPLPDRHALLDEARRAAAHASNASARCAAETAATSATSPTTR